MSPIWSQVSPHTKKAPKMIATIGRAKIGIGADYLLAKTQRRRFLVGRPPVAAGETFVGLAGIIESSPVREVSEQHRDAVPHPR
jgi:hypothetical protein